MFKLITSIILIIVSLGVIFAYVKPQYDATSSVSSEIAEYDEALGKARDIQAQKKALLSQYNIFFAGPNNERLKKMLPKDVDNIRLILDINGMALNRGIQITSIDVKKANNTENAVQTGAQGIGFNTAAADLRQYKTLTIEFTTTTTYKKFLQLLQDLEHSLRLVDLKALKITQGPQKSSADVNPLGDKTATSTEQNSKNETLYKYTVDLETYWLK